MTGQLDPQLLELLACPTPDHAPLRIGTPADPEADALTCTSCGRQFPIVDGVPVLLIDEAVLPDSPAADPGAHPTPPAAPAADPPGQ